MAESVKVGDSVSWSIPKPPGKPSTSHGVVTYVDPKKGIAKIRVYAILEDGEHERTDRVVEIEISKLRIIADIEEKQVSANVRKSLIKKRDEYNEKASADMKITLRTLITVFERGVGAYRTNPASVRGTVTSANQWAMARVNGFIYALENGKFKRSPYDTDLLPKAHPLSTKKSFYLKVDSVPEYIKENAKRGLENLDFAGSGLTEKTIREARAMAKGQITDDKAMRMRAWFDRHKSDLDSPAADDFLSGESEKMTAGQVAWLLWGGDLETEKQMRARDWANRQVEKMEDEKAMLEEDVFSTQEEAERRAEQIGCEGFHTMKDENGEVIYMPCSTHAAYENIIESEGYGEKTMIKKSFYFKEMESEQEGVGIFSGYASVFNTVDRVNDEVQKGAFKKTIAESGGKIKLQFNHKDTIGIADISEDDTGLKVKAYVNLNVQRGREVMSLIKQGAIDRMSFAYEIKDSEKETRQGKTVYKLKELKVYEVSAVDFPANEAAEITAVKQARQRRREAEGFQVDPLAGLKNYVEHLRRK